MPACHAQAVSAEEIHVDEGKGYRFCGTFICFYLWFSNQVYRGNFSFFSWDPLCLLVMIIHLVLSWFGEMLIRGRGREEAVLSDRCDQRGCKDLQTEAVCGGCYFTVQYVLTPMLRFTLLPLDFLFFTAVAVSGRLCCTMHCWWSVPNLSMISL